MKERVVIWMTELGRSDTHWYCSVIKEDVKWQEKLVKAVKAKGYTVLYAGELTQENEPELAAKYPEYAGV